MNKTPLTYDEIVELFCELENNKLENNRDYYFNKISCEKELSSELQEILKLVKVGLGVK